jgi:type IV pilus assembly protein PilX
MPPPRFLRPRRRARGVSMLIALIALLLLSIAAVAMVRSFSTSSVLAGNLAFRRDLTNQGERAVLAVRQAFVAGALHNDVTRELDAPAANYFATRLETNGQGVPLVLVKDSLFTSKGLTERNDITDRASGVTLRYVVDRQCTAGGAYSDSACILSEGTQDGGGSNWLKKPNGESRPVYRVTVRVTGPRNTQAYLQTTLTY